jgi:hypothetical protein
MSFLDELKRRNVIRVGIAYAVSAWVLLQMLDVIGEILELPAWGGKVILVILAAGFFVTLFAAWAFELTPEGIKRESEVDRSQSITSQTGRKLNIFIFALMALAITYLLVDKFVLVPRLAEQELAATKALVLPTESTAVQTADRLSIAVLPFENRSAREQDQFFTDGIHDDLLTSYQEDSRDCCRTRCGKHPRGRHPAFRRTGAHQRAVDRCADRRAPVGRDLRPRADRREPVRHPERDFDPHR